MKKTPVVFTKCADYPIGISTCASCSRYVYKENKESGMKTCIESRNISLLKDEMIRK